ncbi:MAG: hypothetical protein LIO46_06855, partial [Clostridiales bacterium]|nr:hypothetical protein [Clostridiales bacterium]
VDLDLLTASAENRYNVDLVKGSYVINPEKTAFVYGPSLVSLQITYSDDMGETWQTAALTDSVQESDAGYDDAFPVRLRFCSFVSRESGYLIITGKRQMSQDGQMIYRARDG